MLHHQARNHLKQFEEISIPAGFISAKTMGRQSSLGLKEAKELVDGAPSNVKEGCEKAEAEGFKAQLEEVGAVVELK